MNLEQLSIMSSSHLIIVICANFNEAFLSNSTEEDFPGVYFIWQKFGI